MGGPDESMHMRIGTMLEDRVSVLRRFELLKDLSDVALDDLARSCAWHSAPAGKQLIAVHERSRDVYFLASGKVRVLLYSAAEGRPVLFAVLGPYQMFGEVSAIDGNPRSATVEVEQDCTMAILPQEQFQRLLSQHFAFACAVMKQLVAQVRRLSDRVYEFSTLGVQSRVYAELLRLAVLAEKKNGQPVLSPAPRGADLAARVSTSREAVSRVITRLAKKNVVKREGADLRILDIGQLRQLVLEAKGE